MIQTISKDLSVMNVIWMWLVCDTVRRQCTVFAFAGTQSCHLSRSSWHNCVSRHIAWVRGQVWDLFSGRENCTSQNQYLLVETLLLPPTSQFSRPTSNQPSISPVKLATSWFMFKLFPFAPCPYSLCVLILTFLVLDNTVTSNFHIHNNKILRTKIMLLQSFTLEWLFLFKTRRTAGTIAK